ncbi:MAG: CDP-diacylglycerol--serine O-phosphatidyltransferase [Treponema sp.]|jgi:CDP-diacylglycerol--serine O-phosphatidyltransferase|nr:CDP-diacylglycerol--serine O-phosphatidyltransferase [Treponema sp.]
MKTRKNILRRTTLKPKRVRVVKVPIRVPIKFKIEGLKKGIYILPSLFTCGNMSLGILSVFSSINGDFIKAAWFLVGALACDILDGRIARLTNTTSIFGMQLDSLSDLVSFGISPAVMMYMLILKDMEIPGIAIAILFVLCAALRLARFNVLAQSGEIHKHFVGLPTPAAAGLIISFVLSYQLLTRAGQSINFKTIPVLISLIPQFLEAMPVIMVVLSFLMVSNIPYLSFKKFKLTKVRTIELFAMLIVLIILVVVYPQNTIFILFLVYAVSGLLFYVPQIIIKERSRRKLGKLEKAEENDV